MSSSVSTPESKNEMSEENQPVTKNTPEEESKVLGDHAQELETEKTGEKDVHETANEVKSNQKPKNEAYSRVSIDTYLHDHGLQNCRLPRSSRVYEYYQLPTQAATVDYWRCYTAVVKAGENATDHKQRNEPPQLYAPGLVKNVQQGTLKGTVTIVTVGQTTNHPVAVVYFASSNTLKEVALNSLHEVGEEKVNIDTTMTTEKLEKLTRDFLAQVPPKPSQSKESEAIEKLRESLRESNRQISEEQRENRKLEKRIDQLERDNTSLENQCNRLKSKMGKEESLLDAAVTERDLLRNRVDDLELQVQSLKRERPQYTRSNTLALPQQSQYVMPFGSLPFNNANLYSNMATSNYNSLPFSMPTNTMPLNFPLSSMVCVPNNMARALLSDGDRVEEVHDDHEESEHLPTKSRRLTTTIAKFCAHCGVKLSGTNVKFCGACGQKL